MATSPTAQCTPFSRDVIGRYVCNGLDEALRSMDRNASRDARDFDLIIIGGGGFGSILAQHLFVGDKTHTHRILLLEAGPLVFTDHVQNLHMVGLEIPQPTSIAELRAQGRHGEAHDEVWGLAWHSQQKFPGLVYGIGGRSLFWGGWAPSPLVTEMPPELWPEEVLTSLREKYFEAAARQIGVRAPNGFITGCLHDALRQQLYAGLATVSDAISLQEIPQQLAAGSAASLQDPQAMHELDAPLAVHSSPRSGSVVPHKFSGVPLLVKAARAAWVESHGDDVQRRLMIVPHCHVERLITHGGRVTWVQTNQGRVPVPDHGRVILALGTIESARLALESFQGIPHYQQIGRNLMAHLRSTVVMRIPYTSLSHLGVYCPPGHGLEAAALFVRGRHQRRDNSTGHFQLQITAAGLDAMGMESKAALFGILPDIDTLDTFLHNASDVEVVITIRGFAEMAPDTPGNWVTLDPELDEYGLRRALVSLRPSPRDEETRETMDRAIDQMVTVFSNGQPFELITRQGIIPVDPGQADLAEVLADLLPHEKRHDELGATHQEAGTLRMGIDPATSVTDSTGRFHSVDNAYAVGPAVFPTIGSSNPMLTGIALAQRTADILIDKPQLPPLESGFTYLFDGTADTFSLWHRAGKGRFDLIDGELVALPGNELGLLYYAKQRFGDFTLRLEFCLEQVDDNSGVFVRFRNPRLPVPVCEEMPFGVYNNPAYVAFYTGFEVQIDESAHGSPERGIPDGLPQYRTGAIYGIPIGSQRGQQRYQRGKQLRRGVWNSYEITVQGDTYTVRLNDQITTQFTNIDPCRGKAQVNDPRSGYIGLEARTGHVAFRRIRIHEAGGRGLAETKVAVRKRGNSIPGAAEAANKLRVRKAPAGSVAKGSAASEIADRRAETR